MRWKGLYLNNPPINGCISIITYFSLNTSRDYLLDDWSGELLEYLYVVWLFNYCMFKCNYPHYWLKSEYSFTFNQHNVKLTVMLSYLSPGLFTGSKPSLSKSLCPYPFVITGTNATNWLSSINLQISSFVLALSSFAMSILNSLCPTTEKKN